MPKTQTRTTEPIRTNLYEKCPVYWCRFCNGAYCTMRSDDSVKKAVCIKDGAEDHLTKARRS